jgi:hypothetical protein
MDLRLAVTNNDKISVQKRQKNVVCKMKRKYQDKYNKVGTLCSKSKM